MPEFTLASANVHWGMGYSFVGTRHFAYNIAAALRAFDTDVIVLPEAFRPDDGPGMYDELERLGYTVVSTPFMHFDEGSQHTKSVATLQGHWELAVATRLPIVEWDDVPIGTVRNDPPGNRFAIHATLEVEGVRVNVVALHTSSKLWYLGPVTHMRNLRRNLQVSDGPTVIAGDFNCWGPGVVTTLRGYRRAVRGRTWPAHAPHSQIDHVLVNDDVRVIDSEVLAPYGSDHLPVRVRLGV